MRPRIGQVVFVFALVGIHVLAIYRKELRTLSSFEPNNNAPQNVSKTTGMGNSEGTDGFLDVVEIPVDANSKRLAETRVSPSLPGVLPSSTRSVAENEKNNGRLLKPPFRILQIGQERSGSTFQFELLGAIAHLKTLPSIKIDKRYVPAEEFEAHALAHVRSGTSFVFKTHVGNSTLAMQELMKQGEIAVFYSKNDRYPSIHTFGPYSLHTQTKENLLQCSMCEIDHYVPLFGLTETDVHLLKQFMSLFEKLRRCCGLQMSKFNICRLNGCDVSPFLELPAYPHDCQQENMTLVEQQFASLPIPFEELDQQKLWARPGDCNFFDQYIQTEQLGFNGEPFVGCEIAGNQLRREYFGKAGKKQKRKGGKKAQ